jgi:hypothetical protein
LQAEVSTMNSTNSSSKQNDEEGKNKNITGGARQRRKTSDAITYTSISRRASSLEKGSAMRTRLLSPVVDPKPPECLNKVSIIGAGQVGMACAFSLLQKVGAGQR